MISPFRTTHYSCCCFFNPLQFLQLRCWSSLVTSCLYLTYICVDNCLRYCRIFANLHVMPPYLASISYAYPSLDAYLCMHKCCRQMTRQTDDEAEACPLRMVIAVVLTFFRLGAEPQITNSVKLSFSFSLFAFVHLSDQIYTGALSSRLWKHNFS